MSTEEIWENKIKDSIDSDTGFFIRWTILSGGTFSLLIPFLQSMNGTLIGICKFKISEYSLILSFIFAIIGLYLTNITAHKRTGSRILGLTSWKYLFATKEYLKVLSLITYLVAILLLVGVININLLH